MDGTRNFYYLIYINNIIKNIINIIYGNDNMGVTDFIKTRLLNNRVEQYNTKRSYWGEDERQPRTDGINTGLDLVDALPPVINKTIANARYAVKLDGYTSGVLKNRIDKANVNIVLVDKENKLYFIYYKEFYEN